VNKRIRRGGVIVGVALSLVVGLVSIQVAADLAADAAPPPAPPVSIETLKDQLATEQARAAGLQRQLEDLLGVTGQLTVALDATQSQVADDGLTADELRKKLKTAETKLSAVNKLLRKAQARLAALGAAATNASTGSKPATGGGAPAAKPPAAKPPAQTAAFTLSVGLGGGGVHATWTTCARSDFYAYALVRSTDSEIHYPPEDRDTLVAQITTKSATSATDAPAPSGNLWYRLYCLSRHDGENRIVATTSTQRITAP
jgi:hypothetical protein